jgi:hypothetical protein
MLRVFGVDSVARVARIVAGDGGACGALQLRHPHQVLGATEMLRVHIMVLVVWQLVGICIGSRSNHPSTNYYVALQSRKDVEGSLFLVKRRCQPRFQLMILNKKSAGEAVSLWLHGET